MPRLSAWVPALVCAAFVGIGAPGAAQPCSSPSPAQPTASANAASAAPAQGVGTVAIVKLSLDGRPVDRKGDTAVRRGGVIYGDVVDLVRSFDGLLTFQGNAVVVTVNATTARFTEGSRTALVNQGAVTMPGRTFRRERELYVPLETFVVRVAHAKLVVNSSQTRADILVNANP